MLDRPEISRRPLQGMGLAGLLIGLTGLSGCGISVPTVGSGQILAIGAENQYADVIAQVGGPYVRVAAILENPNTDPHTFEASPSVAATLAQARLVVQNGLGYDGFMARIEAATPSSRRRVLSVQHLLGVPDSAPNPHLWYSPRTMPAVAAAVGRALAEALPAHASYFRAAVRRFDRSLGPWERALARLRAFRPRASVATTEPVADSLIDAAGVANLTPFTFQADVMDGTDPAPQAIAIERGLLAGHRVAAFVYNVQVTDTVTDGLRALARAHGIPLVGVYETLPRGFTYARWMLAETVALSSAIEHGSSTGRL